MTLPWWIILGAGLISAFAVLSREALAEFSFSDMEELLRKRNRSKSDLPRVERLAEIIRDIRYVFRLVDYVGRAALAVAVWQVMPAESQAMAWGGFALAMLGATFVLDVVLRPLAAHYAEQLTLALLRPWMFLFALLWLPSIPFHATYHVIVRLLHGGDTERSNEEKAEDEILQAVSMGEYAGQIDEQERDMIESVLALGDITVERLMTPRTDMHAVPLEGGMEAALESAKATGHSRLPVYDGNRDNIIGICYVKDLIGLNVEEAGELGDHLRKPTFVPESKLVSELLKEFRRERVHLAVVLDEYGGTAGLVTIEDIVEEVFGDIDDEYDRVGEAEVRTIGESTLDLDARMRVDEVNERFDVNLPEDDQYESLGGLLTSRLGRIPEQGEQWEHEAVRLTAVEVTDRRVVRVRLERQEADVKAKAG